MSERYASPLALKDAIEAKVGQRIDAAVHEREFATTKDRDRFRSQYREQLRRDVAIQRLVARLEATMPGEWVIKGGIALQLRLDPSRASLDLDVAYAGSEVDRKLQIGELERAAARSLDDFMTFEFDRSNETLDIDGSTTLPVDVFIGGTKFVRFDVDVAPVGARTDSEDRDVALPIDIELPVPMTTVRIIRLDRQIADKVCAMFEMRGDVPSQRWRDLADLAMIATQVRGLRAADIAGAIEAEVPRRRETLSAGLPQRVALHARQLEEWPRIWGDRGREVPFGFERALEVVEALLNPILDGTATGTWDVVLLDWR